MIDLLSNEATRIALLILLFVAVAAIGFGLTSMFGERREMPVVFVIDSKLPDDMSTITLSYTFFEVEGAAKVARVHVDPRIVSEELK